MNIPTSSAFIAYANISILFTVFVSGALSMDISTNHIPLSVVPQQQTIQGVDDRLFWTIGAAADSAAISTAAGLTWNQLDGAQLSRISKTAVLDIQLRAPATWMGSDPDDVALPLPVTFVTAGWSSFVDRKGGVTPGIYDCYWHVPGSLGKTGLACLQLDAPRQDAHRTKPRLPYVDDITAIPSGMRAAFTIDSAATLSASLRMRLIRPIAPQPYERSLTNLELWQQTVVEWVRLADEPGDETLYFSSIMAGLVTPLDSIGPGETTTAEQSLPERTCVLSEVLKDPRTGIARPGHYLIRLATCWTATAASTQADGLPQRQLFIARSQSHPLKVAPASGTAPNPR